jgi:uncharacterized protein YkwD
VTRLGILLAMTLPILANASPAAAADAHPTRRAHGSHVHITCTTLPSSNGRHRGRRVAGCVAGAKKREPGRTAEPGRTTEPRKITEPQVPSSAALARAATIARVLATACQNVQLMPEPANIAQVRAAVLCLINRLRAQHGETPLTPNAPLEHAAEAHAQEMVALNYFDHISPSGLTPVGRVRGAGYIPSTTVGYVIGENLAWGTLSLATPEAIVAAWSASPGHLANILESQYRDTGVGVVPQVPGMLANGASGATYAQEFGVIIR